MPPRTRRRTATVGVPRKRRRTAAEEETIRDVLVKQIGAAAEFIKGDQVAPCAILWPDGERRWQSVINELMESMPALHILGAWQPDDRTGPAIWLRCVEGRVLDQRLPDDVTPVFYLPGVNAETLRHTSECPPALAPLVELQFRGVMWTDQNGRDWTPFSWLSSLDGIEVEKGTPTVDAIQRALPRLLAEPVANVGRIDAEFCHGLVAPDMPAQLLRWMDEPAKAQQQGEPMAGPFSVNSAKRITSLIPSAMAN